MPSGTCWRRFFASSLDVVFFWLLLVFLWHCWCCEWVLVDRIVLVVVVVVVPFVNLLRGPLFVQSEPSSLSILAALSPDLFKKRK